MNREDEQATIETTQAQEWAKRNMAHYEPRWSRARVFAFWVAVAMAAASCWLGWLEITK